MEAGLRGNKNLKKLCKLTYREFGLADKVPQPAWLEFFSSRGNAKVTSIGMIKGGMISSSVVKREVSSCKGFGGIISSYYGQICHQTGISVSLVTRVPVFLPGEAYRVSL